MFQGRREESIQRNCCFPFDPKQVDAVVLSHAHIDHAGNLPNLCKQGYTGNIYCTFATRDLSGIMLVDSAQIQKDDAAFVSKKRAKQKLPPVEPLYSEADAEQALQQFVAFNYDRPFPVLDGVTVTFRDAGHILGSAQVVLDVREGGRQFRYLFSGDVGRGNDEILRDPEPVENVDYLQIESTYGGREHSVRTDADETVGRLVLETLKQNGKVIIPAFSVGRTQQIVYVLHQLTLAGKLPRVPIFVDSPLSVNATEIYRLHPECFNDTINQFLHEKENPFGMENLTYIREVANSQETERFEGTRHHHQRVGHVRSRAHPASSQKPHRQPGQSDSVHRLLCGTHAGRADRGGTKSGQHFRRTAGGARQNRFAGHLLRPRGQK